MLLIVVVRVMPSDFELASSEGDRDQPPCEEKGEYQGQRSGVHRPSPSMKDRGNREPLAVTQVTGASGNRKRRARAEPRRKRKQSVSVNRLGDSSRGIRQFLQAIELVERHPPRTDSVGFLDRLRDIRLRQYYGLGQWASECQASG